MKIIFWNNEEQPTVAQAKFITYWALSNVCELSPGLIKAPIHIAQLSKDSSGHFVATEAGAVELEEHAAIMWETFTSLYFRSLIRTLLAADVTLKPQPFKVNSSMTSSSPF